MQIIYSPKHRLHDPVYEIYEGRQVPYPEKPLRIESILNALKPDFGQYVIKPKHFPASYIKLMHHRQMVNFIKSKSAMDGMKQIMPSDFIMDTYTPLTKGTYKAATVAVDIVLTGCQKIQEGEQLVYCLCRPPGHHAQHKSTGGYCYFNNAAIAANYLSNKGKVAILDIDFHHGNGIQSFFYDRRDVFYVSIHADPRVRFPYISGFVEEIGAGRGKGYNLNFPLKLGTTNEQYHKTLLKSLKAIKNYRPDFLIVCCGFDTHIDDPIGGFKLTTPYYKDIAYEISSLWLPTLLVQEGGYNTATIGEMASNFLEGFRGHKL